MTQTIQPIAQVAQETNANTTALEQVVGEMNRATVVLTSTLADHP